MPSEDSAQVSNGDTPRPQRRSLWYQYHRVNGADARIYAYRPDVSAGLPVALNGVGSHTGAKVSRSFGPLLLAVRYTIRAIQTGIGTDWAAQVELHR